MNKLRSTCIATIGAAALAFGLWQTSAQPVDTCCPNAHGYWKGLALYPCENEVLSAPSKNNAVLILGKQLIAAEYNFAVLGCLPDPKWMAYLEEQFNLAWYLIAEVAYPDSDSWCDVLEGSPVKVSSDLGQAMIELASVAEAYNEGMFNDCRR
jgi:hypothetical protein